MLPDQALNPLRRLEYKMRMLQKKNKPVWPLHWVPLIRRIQTSRWATLVAYTVYLISVN